MTKGQTALVVGIFGFLLVFLGTDYWTGKSYTIPGTIQDTHMDISSTDDSSSVSISYYAEVSTDENMGMPMNAIMSSGQYKGLKYGDKVSVEISRGGITKWAYSKKIR